LSRNVVQGRSFSEMLEQSLRRYRNRGIETAKVIEELIQLEQPKCLDPVMPDGRSIRGNAAS
jgi:hypothetical protein